MTKDDILTRDEIDTMWQQALCAAVADGDMFTRYRFSALLEAKVRADEREACAKECEAEAQGRSPSLFDALCDCADAIRARGEK
jgi:hypothetical protein